MEQQQAKSKRDLIWEQKKKLREQKLNGASSQESVQPNERVDNKFEIFQERKPIEYLVSQEIDYPQENKFDFANLGENNKKNNYEKIPVSLPSEPIEDPFARKKNLIEYSPPVKIERNTDDHTYQAKVMKKEYGEYLKNQMKEKENNRNQSDKKEQLQSLMENKSYNPFGKPGGGGPNRNNLLPKSTEIPYSDQHNQINQNNFNQNNQINQNNYINEKPQTQRNERPNVNNYEYEPRKDNYNPNLYNNNINNNNNNHNNNVNSNYDNQPSKDIVNNNIGPSKVGKVRNVLHYENIPENEILKKESKTKEMQQALLQQIEQKKRAKELEKQKRKEEELVEEMKIKREREELEREIKTEEEKKKAKIERVAQENQDIKEQKKNKVRENGMEQPPIENKNFQEPLPQNMIFKTDVSKEFLELEGKNSRKNLRRPQPEPQMMIRENPEMRYGVNGTEFIRREIKNEIDKIKYQLENDKNTLQMQLMQVKEEAIKAVDLKNKAEKDLIALREQLQGKIREEEKYKYTLQAALQKNEPKAYQRITNNCPPILPNKLIQNNYGGTPSYQETKNNLKYYIPSRMPIKIYERGDQTINFEADKTLACETKLVPLETLDQFIRNNQNKELTFSKLNTIAQRPNSSNIIENSRMYDNNMELINYDRLEYEKSYEFQKKRPNSQKYLREEKFDNSNIDDELTKEIEMLVKRNQNDNLRKKNNTPFTQAARGVLNENINNNGINYYNNQAIKLDSGFPTLRDDDTRYEADKTSKPDLTIKNNNYSAISKEQSFINKTFNLEDINRKNDERLKNIESFSKGNEAFLYRNNLNNKNLNSIKEDDEFAKLDRLIGMYNK